MSRLTTLTKSLREGLAVDPLSYRRYNQLRSAVHNPDYHINVLPARKVIYFDIPKAACTTIKVLLSEALHGPFGHEPLCVHNRKMSRIPRIREVSIRRFFRMVDDPETLIFTFVRNPYERIVSCYRDKVEKYPIGACIGSEGFTKEVQEFFGQQLSKLDADKPLPFTWFVEMICETARSGKNGHWLAMDRLLPTHDVRCGFTGRVEQFDSDLEIVCGQIGVAPPIGRKLNVSGPPYKISDWITSSMKDRIRLAYREDFERFRYSTAFPN
jgi:hypothetical protein